MNDLMASIGISQLRKLKRFNLQRKKILVKYLRGIENLKSFKPTFPYILKDSSYWLFSIRTKKREQLINFLRKKNISTAVHFVPLPMNKLYKKYKGKVKNSLKIWKELVSLPFFPDLDDKKINYIIKCLKLFDKKNFNG